MGNFFYLETLISHPRLLHITLLKLINPTHKMGSYDFLGSFTTERTMVEATWFLDLPFIHSLDNGSW